MAEFCAKEKAELPHYETVISESNPNIPIFSISAHAFGFTTIGVGRTKSDAKHAASQNLIGKYKVHEHVLLLQCKMNCSWSVFVTVLFFW